MSKNNIKDLSGVRRVHFIGIGGIGVSAIARMCIERGMNVSGSDQSEGKIVDELRVRGAQIYIGHDARHVPHDAHLVVHTIAIPESNPELEYARKAGIWTCTYPEILSMLSKEMKTVAVAGTHGKTTTTGMVATCLLHAQKDPTVVIGSLLKTDRGFTNFVAGKSEYFVVEACEYKRSFLHIAPDVAVITNIDNDHLDYYKDIEDIQKAFCEFVSRIKPNGVLVTDVGHVLIQPVVAHARAVGVRVVDYASSDVWAGNTLGSLKVPGEHTRKNAAAAYEACRAIGVAAEDVRQGLSLFSGTWRRFEYRGKTEMGVIVYDDYGHHPTEIRATLAAAREFFGSAAHIIVVFQPHLYSRTKEHFEEFVGAFDAADDIVLVPIYAAREAFDPTVSHHMLAEAVTRRLAARGHMACIALDSLQSACEYVRERGIVLEKSKTAPTVCITMGAGDVYIVADELVHTLP